jgi:hypothetical protein
MIKKVLLLIILIAIVGVVGYFMFARQSAQITTGKLSERSQEFINKQKQNNSSDLQFARLDKGEDKAGSFVGKKIEVGDCFSFVMVFRVTNPRQDGECNWYFGIENPKGFITAYRPDGTPTSVDQIDGVTMRRASPDKYAESKMTVNGSEYLIFKGREGKYEANVFGFHSGSAIIFNLLTASSDNYDEKLQAMLGSITFK